MTDEKPDSRFWEVADEVIHIANQHSKEMPPGRVSAAVLYGAARFNAFVIASAPNADIQAQKESALDYLTGQYRRMLIENLDDFQNSGDRHQ